MRILKNSAWIFIVIAFVVLAVFIYGRKNRQSVTIPPNPNLKIETVSLADFERKLDGLKGNVVLLNFWATWCPPCVGEIPDLVRLHEKYSPKGLVIIGFSMDTKPADYVRDFAGKLGITYAVCYSSEAEMIADKYGFTNGIPYTVILNSAGKQEKSFLGALSYEEFEGVILPFLPEAVFQEPPPAGAAVKKEDSYDIKIHIVGPKADGRTETLLKAAEAGTSIPGIKAVIDVLDPAEPEDKKLIDKEWLEITDVPTAHACSKETCFPPTTDPEELKKFIQTALKKKD